MSEMRVAKGVYEKIRAHGEETYPHECCGALIGKPTADGWSVTGAVRAGNARTDSAHNRYSIAPIELIRIERQARQQQSEIAGFYHSHPDYPAQWSPTDFAEAHWLGCLYVITAVAKGRAEVTNAFLLTGKNEDEKRFDPATIAVTEE